MRRTVLVVVLVAAWFASVPRAQVPAWNKLGQGAGTRELKIAKPNPKVNIYKFELAQLRNELLNAGINEKITIELSVKGSVLSLGTYQPVTTAQGVRFASLPNVKECGSSMEPLPLTLDSSMEPLPGRLLVRGADAQIKSTWNVSLKWSRDNGSALTPLK